MSQTLTYTIGADKRALVSDIQDFHIDFTSDNSNWVQARQYEDSMRQVFVNVKNQDGTPYNLTGANIWFEGILPDKTHKILDAEHAVILDATNGQFRFDMPKQAFAVAGSYQQAFFRIVRDGASVTTLEFDLEVLADKVISGLVPKDWIGPFEEIADQLVDDLQKHTDDADKIIANFQQKVTDLINQLNQQGSTTTSMLTELQNRITALETKITQDGLFTQAEADSFKKTVIDDASAAINDETVQNYSSKMATDGQNFYLEDLPDYMQSSFDHATSVPSGDNIVNIAMITDNHHQEDVLSWSNQAYSGKSLEHYQWFAQSTIRNKPEAVIADGDNVNGDSYRPTVIYETMHVWSMLNTAYVGSSIFMIPGNHDSGVGQTGGLKVGNSLTQRDLKNIYHSNNPLFGEVRNQDSLYFYKDFSDKKVRLIGLDSSDLPWTSDSDGNYKHNRLTEAGFSSDQLQWLVNKALLLPDNTWQVVFFFHHPLSSSIFYNAQALIDIIKTFKNGGTASITRSDVADMPINALQVDFSKQGPGVVIGVFNGHYHADSSDLTTLNGTPIVITDASLSSAALADQLARRNTVNEDCWETISIDTSSRKIHCYRFGRGSDRDFTY